jgi:hypothetical protein
VRPDEIGRARAVAAHQPALARQDQIDIPYITKRYRARRPGSTDWSSPAGLGGGSRSNPGFASPAQRRRAGENPLVPGVEWPFPWSGEHRVRASSVIQLCFTRCSMKDSRSSTTFTTEPVSTGDHWTGESHRPAY